MIREEKERDVYAYQEAHRDSNQLEGKRVSPCQPIRFNPVRFLFYFIFHSLVLHLQQNNPIKGIPKQDKGIGSPLQDARESRTARRVCESVLGRTLDRTSDMTPGFMWPSLEGFLFTATIRGYAISNPAGRARRKS